jgi:flavodoxin
VRILVAYLSQTGNTEKVATAIYNAIPESHQKDFKHLEQVKSLEGYDLSYLGFPMHNFGPDKQAADLLNLLTKSQNVALFITHAAPEGSGVIQEWVQKFADAAVDAHICGIFDCQGELAQQIKAYMLNQPNLELQRWAQADNSQGQPDEIRIEKAKKFAIETIKKSNT